MILLPTILMFNIIRMPGPVTARFCEGGHYCSLPRECCTQGCCPPYQSGPRQLPPPSEHVLNLFFISHWFFWCVVVAVILAILCAYSLWKKRRTLCGWGFTEHHTQSEGDSAGSCYAPPQYSRCNSFHHPPPPYTEVTSKPDLYPLVFTCNSDNVKTGSSYLMVQYFRNYIVRPVGSLSAASTVDSLSSSFICNINEANTLVPPPYSRAASPEAELSSHLQQQFMIPRSASQLMYASGGNRHSNNLEAHEISSGVIAQKLHQDHHSKVTNFTVVALNGSAVGNQNDIELGKLTNYNTVLQTSVGEYFNSNEVSDDNSQNRKLNQNYNRDSNESSGSNRSSGCASNFSSGCIPKGFIQSQSDQQFHFINNSNSSISDIFLNNCSIAAFANTPNENGCNLIGIKNSEENGKFSPSESADPATTLPMHTQFNNHAASAIFSNSHIKSKSLHRTATSPTPLVFDSSILNPTYKSCDSVADILFTAPANTDNLSDSEVKDLHLLRQSLETCCNVLQQQHQLKQRPHAEINKTESSSSRLNELIERYAADDLGMSNYTGSVNCSAVSSLVNICLPSSPPQATSPTGEVREILDQIRQLQDSISHEDVLLHMKPALRQTLSSPKSISVVIGKDSSANTQPKKICGSVTCCEIQPSPTVKSPTNPTFSKTTVRLTSPSSDKSIVKVITTTAQDSLSTNDTDNLLKRPVTLQHKRKLFTPKPNKALYIPMTPNITSTPANKYILKSPLSSAVGTNFFSSRGGRVRKIWVSRSAPTTPGTTLPPNRLGDDSPLLTEYDEDGDIVQGE
ncbi:PREDICTED: uncharacterized protein LOC108360098 [Rhagoletis zephyria]|uniref:uncharacterized protein LOC108360098 n=1 Tax=Rhagoletis zephyria TaxID=28612 RepID=UPI000811A716|nr:PREDICTED: uncharacterized protein LOC108360098 [Rhagoletis zephyria]